MGKEPDRYKNWYLKPQRLLRDKEAAVKMFLRSMEKHQLVDTDYVGDGDSSSFAEVAFACFKKFGNQYLAWKEDFIGHIQKRMVSNLQNYKNKNKGRKLSDGGTVGGSRSDAIIMTQDPMQ